MPQQIKDELKIMCVLFTEDIGGIFELVFDEDGTLEFRTSCDEGDLLYDEIGCGLKSGNCSAQRKSCFVPLKCTIR